MYCRAEGGQGSEGARVGGRVELGRGVCTAVGQAHSRVAGWLAACPHACMRACMRHGLPAGTPPVRDAAACPGSEPGRPAWPGTCSVRDENVNLGGSHNTSPSCSGLNPPPAQPGSGLSLPQAGLRARVLDSNTGAKVLQLCWSLVLKVGIGLHRWRAYLGLFTG